MGIAAANAFVELRLGSDNLSKKLNIERNGKGDRHKNG